MRGARAPGHPHPVVSARSAPLPPTGTDLFYLIVTKILKKKSRNRNPGAKSRRLAGTARPPRRGRSYRKSAELLTIYFLIMNVFY
uniref:Uncharacterized protein n=1 Tax=Pararge aegeria TaxID=116150 RepID=S4PAH5_9NEOP